MKNSAFDNKARAFMKYDEDKGALIVELTDNVAFEYMKMIRHHLWPEVESMKMETVDVVSESGEKYNGVRRYTIPAAKDRVEVFFDAAKGALANSIKKSIPNSDN